MLRKRVRLWAWTLAVLLVFEVFSVSAAEQSTDDVSEYASPIATEEFFVLKNLGMTHAETEELYEDHAISRADFAYVLAKLMGYHDEESAQTNSFADVEGTEYYAGALCFLKNRKIVYGVQQGMFEPQESISVTDAYAMVLHALGYEKLAKQKYGDWPVGVIRMAAELDLSNGVTETGDTPLSVRNAFVLLYHAALAPVLKPVIYGDTVDYTQNAGDTLLYLYHGILQGSGIMTDNGITALNGVSEVGADRAVIGGKFLKTTQFPEAYQLLGRTVEFYYTEKESVLLYAFEESDTNRVLELDASDLCKTDSSFSVSNIVYYNSQNKLKKCSVTVNADYIYNGSAYLGVTAENLKIEAGNLVLIDNGDDGIYDVVLIQEYKDYVVASVSNRQIAADGEVFDLNLYDAVHIFNASGNAVAEEDLIKDSVLSIYESRDKKQIDIFISTEKLNDQVAEIKENDWGETCYCINGNDYTLSPSLYKNVANNAAGAEIPELGKKYVIYLNYRNQIVRAKPRYQDEWYYAYCVGIADAGNSAFSGKEVKAKLIMPDNMQTDFFFSEKVVCNGETGVKAESLLSSNAFFADGLPIRQPVRIKLDSKGVIIKIDTPLDRTTSEYGYDTENFSKDAYMASGIFRGGVRLSLGTYVIASNAVMFLDPYLNKNDKVYNGDDVEALTPEQVNNSTSSYTLSNVYLYEMDESLTSPLVVFEGYSGSSNQSSMLLVDCVYESLNDEGEFIKTISGYLNHNRVEYTERKAGIIPDNLKQGDCCRINLNTRDSKIDKLDKIVSLSADPEPFISAMTGSMPDGDWVNLYGYVYAKSNNSVVILAPDGYEKKVVATSLGGETTKVYIYDIARKNIATGTLSDIYTNLVPDKNGNVNLTADTPKILIHRTKSVASEIVVVRD